MTFLRLKPGVLERLVWSHANSAITPFCSLCQAYIPDDTVPLMMWNDNGALAHFCDRCVAESVEVSK